MKHLALAIAFAAAVSAAFGQDATLVANGGFEQTTGDLPTGWTRLKDGVTVTAEAQHVRTGRQAVRLKPNAEPGQPHPSATLYSGKVRIEPGKRYRATVWAKGKGRVQLAFWEYGPQGKWLGGVGLGQVRVTEDWRPHVLHYGNPSAAESVVVALDAGGAESEVFVDDVTLEVVGLPKGSEGPSNGEVRSDKAGRGAAAGWAGPANRLSIEPDGKGGFCQRFDARMFAADARGDLKTEGYFNWRVASAVSPPTWLSFHCEPFAVEPGATQEISFRLRADRIHALHLKLRHFDREGRPYDQTSGVNAYYQLGGTRDGSWNYQRFLCRATNPTTAGQAQIEFWCLCGGGSIWVDDLAIKTLVAPPLHPSAFTTEWQNHSGPVPKPKTRDRDPRTWLLVEEPLPPKPPHVKETPSYVRVWLKTGVMLYVRRAGERILGISLVGLARDPLLHGGIRTMDEGVVLFVKRGEHLRNGTPPMAPLVETVEGGEYVACVYRGHELRQDEVVLRTELRDSAGSADQLDWHFAPHEVKVGDLTYRGLAYWYSFRSVKNHVLQIVDRATWELGGTPIGLTVVDQNTYAGQSAFLLTEDSPYCSGNGARFVGGECLDYQFAPEGALFAYFERPCFVRYQRMGTPEFVMFRDAHQFAGTTEAVTTRKYVLWADRGSRDHWLEARDFAYAQARKQAGIVRDTPLPLANVWTDWRDLAQIGKGKYYQKVIDDYLPAIADAGFKRILIHETWEHGGCSPSDLAINSEFGGEAALKRLCDAARARGIEVIAWYGPGHLWTKTPLFKERPEFLLKGRGDEPPTTYCWPDITGVDLTGPWFGYAIGKLKGIRERTGLGGFWLDSYINFTHGVKCATRELEIRQAEAIVRFHAAIQQLGYVTYTEASSDFGIKSNGFPVGGLDAPEPTWPAPDEFADTSPYLGGWREEREIRLAEGLMEGDRYFRYLANKCVPFVYWRRFRDRPEWHAKLTQANRAYNAVVSFMDKRQLLPDDKGVVWTSADGRTRVLFAFEPQRLDAPAGCKAFLAPEMTPVALDGRQGLEVERGKVYVVRQ